MKRYRACFHDHKVAIEVFDPQNQTLKLLDWLTMPEDRRDDVRMSAANRRLLS